MRIYQKLLSVMRHDEHGVAATSAAILAVLAIVTVLSTWWARSAERDLIKEGRAAQLAGLATMLNEVVRTLAAHDDDAALRRVVVETKDSFKLSQCRIMLPDGRIVADAVPGRINVATLPAHWASGPMDAETAPASPSLVTTQFPVTVPERGMLVVYLALPVGYPTWARSDIQLGLGAIGAAGLGAFLIPFQHLRQRVAGLGAIRTALRHTREGQRDPAFLCLSPTLGADAVSWNALVEEQEALRRTSVANRARDLLGSGPNAAPELEAACDTLSDGLIVVGSDGTVRYANGAGCVFVGVEQPKLVGSPLLPHLKDPVLQEALTATLNGKERQRRQLEIASKDGATSTILRFEIRALRHHETAEVLLIIRDVTQQRVADEARNSLVAHVVHELRTPLTTIGLYLETAAEEGEKDPVIRAQCLNVITQESRRLQRIVSEMLSVSEIEAGSMKLNLDDVRLEALFQDLQHDYAAAAGDKKIQLLFEMPSKYPVIAADRDRLGLAFHNLLGNALKYTPPGGTVKVILKVQPNQWQLEVTDTGIGIEEKEQEAVFDRFYRSKDPRVLKITGTGLGLALAREVVRLHHGDITLQSQLNKGSSFIVTLPLPADRGS